MDIDRAFNRALGGLALLGLYLAIANRPGTSHWGDQTTQNAFGTGVVLFVLTASAWIAIYIAGRRDTRDMPYDPPEAPPAPWQPQPAPLPQPDPVHVHGGHKAIPVNRELPIDRPHPWRTWEG